MLVIIESLGGLEFAVVDGQPQWKERGADAFSPFSSSAIIELFKTTTSLGGVTYHLPIFKSKATDTYLNTELKPSGNGDENCTLITQKENEFLYLVNHSYNGSNGLTPYDETSVVLEQGEMETIAKFPIYSSGFASVTIVKLKGVNKLTFPIKGYTSSLRMSVVEVY